MIQLLVGLLLYCFFRIMKQSWRTCGKSGFWHLAMWQSRFFALCHRNQGTSMCKTCGKGGFWHLAMWQSRFFAPCHKNQGTSRCKTVARAIFVAFPHGRVTFLPLATEITAPTPAKLVVGELITSKKLISKPQSGAFIRRRFLL